VARSRSRPARWALQDAKNRFSEVVDAALRGEPQVVTRRGVETAVIIAHDAYVRMVSRGQTAQRPFSDYLLNGPRADVGIDRIRLRARDEV